VKAAADNIRLKKEQFKQDKKMDAERAKLQKVADKEEKEAAKVAKKKAVLIVPEKPRPSHVTFGGIEYKVIDLGAEWTLAELKALIDAVKVIEEKKLHDVTFLRKGSIMLAAVKYYIEVFPNSIIGEGIKGEHVAASGIGRKFKNCDDLDGIHMYIYLYIYIYI
jgi:hypothetical protein